MYTHNWRDVLKMGFPGLKDKLKKFNEMLKNELPKIYKHM